MGEARRKQLAALAQAARNEVRISNAFVIDTNYANDARLEDYFKASPNNYAVLTDFFGAELGAGESVQHFREKHSILSRHPEKVLIARNVFNQTGINAESPMDLIDPRKTADFKKSILQIMAATPGSHYETELEKRTVQSRILLSELLVYGEHTDQLLAGYVQELSQGDLKALRMKDRSQFSTTGLLRICGHIVDMTSMIRQAFIAESGAVYRPKNHHELMCSMPFRMAVAQLHSMLGRISDGTRNLGPKAARNDLIDSFFAACALPFDGILSADERANKTYSDSFWFMHLFGALVNEGVIVFSDIPSANTLMLDE